MPGDVFPDLHHKMSKKIAQLTKVIYHLNTKNEDRQARIRATKKSSQRDARYTEGCCDEDTAVQGSADIQEGLDKR
ncbi:unnamed protein product, partial [Choristocarpus tenellus]